MARIYLDNAATSWPKPEAVYAAVDHYQRQLGAPTGRGVYTEALQVDRLVQQARWRLSELIQSPDPRHIIFAFSGTDALTLAIRGTLRPGDHVITSVCDHNSVLRPLRLLEREGQINVTRIGCDDQGLLHPADVTAALCDSTRLVALTHASNVTGAVQPIEAVAQAMQGHPALLLVDAAQTIGHQPVSVAQLGCQLLAAPCHKGLFAPTGTGFLYIAPDVEKEILPVRVGGTGTSSHSDEPPDELPSRFEAGNLNAAGLIGLEAGLRYLSERGVESIMNHESRLTEQLLEGIKGLMGVRVVGPSSSTPRAAVVSLQIDGHDPQDIAILLDQVASIQIRAGLHCAPLMHRALQTIDRGGTVRVSFGAFQEPSDVDALLRALKQLVA